MNERVLLAVISFDETEAAIIIPKFLSISKTFN